MPTVVQDERIIRVQYGTKTWEFISVSVSDYWIRSVDERFSEGQLWTTVGFSMTAPRFVTIKILRLCYSLCYHTCLAFSLSNGKVQNILLHVQLVPKSTTQLEDWYQQFIWSRSPNTSNFQDYSIFLSLPPEFSIKSFSGKVLLSRLNIIKTQVIPHFPSAARWNTLGSQDVF